MTLHARPIAVTGADGFIGSALVTALVVAGACVRAVSGPQGAGSRALPAAVPHSRADITSLADLRQALAGSDTLIHLAGPPSVAHSLRQPVEHARVHVLGTATVLQACADLGIRRLVYLSSAEVYGRGRSAAAVTEQHEVAPCSPYAASKAAAEQLIRAATAYRGLHSVILRPFSIYGPGMSAQSLLGSLLEQLPQAQALSVHDLRPVRDYCHVDDLVCAVLHACTTAAAAPLTCNIGSGHGTSVRALAATLLAAAGRRLPVRESPGGRRPQGSDILHLVADVQRARTVLGWVPRIALRDGLAGLLQPATRAAEAP